MKTSKFNLPAITIIALVLFIAGIISSCSTKSSKEENAKEEEAEGHEHDSTEAHHHDHDKVSGHEGVTDSIMWMPSEQLFSGKLKLVGGDPQKLNTSLTTDNDGSKVLTITLSGNQVVLLFDDMLENIGSNLRFKTDGYQGQVTIVHHYTDETNYDYLSLNNTSMQLGRVEKGKINLLDKEDIKMPGDWATLTVSAAGEHYKGSLNDKLVNHGHGETRPAGRVGVLLEGKGKVMLKMIEVVKLSE